MGSHHGQWPEMLSGALALIISAVGLWTTAYWWRRGRRDVLRWPTVPGQLLETSARIPTNRSASRRIRRWEPVVRFSYQVADHTYEGSQIYLPWPPTSTRSEVDQFLQSLPDHPTVHYNPEDPSQSVLFPAPLAWFLWFFAGSAGAGLLGLMFLVTSQ